MAMKDVAGTYIVASSMLEGQRSRQPMDFTPELLGEIRRLKEQADWLGGLLDEDSQFAYGTDGTVQFGTGQGYPSSSMFSFPWAYSQCLFRPSYGACFYINWTQHNIIRARSRAFCSINPYFHGVQHSLKTHVVGTGHNWTVVPRSPEIKVPEKKIAKVQKELDDFYMGTGIYQRPNGGGYRKVQCEKVERKSRDGEYFLQVIEKGGIVRVRFVEPLCVGWEPDGVRDDGKEILLGIEYEQGDYENPLRYHVRTMSFHGGMLDPEKIQTRPITASEMQHRKVNVDEGTPRGIPDTYWVQTRLEQSIRTLKSLGTLTQVRSKIALIRTHVNALAGSVQPMINAGAATTITDTSGQTRSVLSLPDGAMLDKSDQSTYQMPSQNVDAKDLLAPIQAELQAVATATGLADYMVSGSLSSGSYATAMVASGPVVKTFQEHQQEMLEEDRQIAMRAIQARIDAGKLDEDTLEVMTIEMHGPSLAASEGVQDAQARQIEHQQGVLSLATWRQMRGYDNNREATNVFNEAEQQALVQALAVRAQSAVLGMMPGSEQIAAGQAQADGGNGSGGSQNGTGPRNRQTPNARPFSADEEPRQIQRASGATREEAVNDE